MKLDNNCLIDIIDFNQIRTESEWINEHVEQCAENYNEFWEFISAVMYPLN